MVTLLSIGMPGGRTWNFSKLTTKNLTEGGFFGEQNFMHDVGFEVRWRFVTAYRFPIRSYFGMSWRLRDLQRRSVKDPHAFTTIPTDARRFYFGIRI